MQVSDSAPVIIPRIHAPCPHQTNELALFIQSFPWSNGITLQHGSMTQIIEKTSFHESPGIDQSLILVSYQYLSLMLFFQDIEINQTQARLLDAFHFKQKLQDPRTQALLARLRTTDRRAFFAAGGWKNVSTADIDEITHVLVRLNVLDQCLDALSFPSHLSLPKMSRIPFPENFPRRLRQVRCCLHVPESLISSFMFTRFFTL